MIARPIVLVLVLVSVVLLGAVAQDPQPTPAGSTQAPAQPTAESAVRVALREIQRTMVLGGRAEAEQVAPRLRELDRQPMSKGERDSWLRVARDVAVRTGDLAWLRSLRDAELAFGTELSHAVMLANAQLAHANLDGAQATLRGLGELDRANEREKRRVFALQARVAQLQQDHRAERAAVEQLVDHLYMWPRQRCQECHASEKAPNEVTSLPVSTLWFGERFVLLMQKQGDAEDVRATAAQDLKLDPTDDEARIRLAFALRALGREDEAMARFRELPWASFPDRPGTKARQLATYP